MRDPAPGRGRISVRPENARALVDALNAAADYADE